MEYVIERLSAKNIYNLVPLYRVSFRQAIPLSVLIKKYDTRVFGPEFVGFIAFTPEGTAAAYYGVIPCNFQLNGKTILAAQSADTMTHPSHRKKGLFKILATKTYELARNEGIRFVFGFPNQESFPGFVKLGWQFNKDQLQLFTIKAGNFSYARILKKSNLLFNLYNVLLRAILGKEHPTETFFETKHFDGVRHDHTFCSYKTYNTTFTISINDVKAWVKADGRLKVGAVCGLTQKCASDFIIGLTAVASRMGCSDVVFMTSKNSPLYPILTKSLTPKDAFPIGFYSLTNEPHSFDDAVFEYCDVDIF